MNFSQKLREEVDANWEQSFRHPFIIELTEGTLPEDKFIHYIRNDSYYLTTFSKVQATGASKAPDLQTAGRLAFHAHSTANAEHALHQTFFTMMGIEKAVDFVPSPTAYQYTSHLVRVAEEGSLAEIIAAILPCYWLYWEIGLKYQNRKPDHPVYLKWVETYGDEWFGELVNEQIHRLDVLAEQASGEEQQRMAQHFKISSEYEYRFWEMAYTLERWPFDTDSK